MEHVSSLTLWRTAFLCIALTLPATVAAVDTGSFAHITDIHYDSHYVVNSSTVLGRCHRGTGSAGEFGFRALCDSPQSLVNSTIGFLKQLASSTYSLDFIVWTGDNARHNADPELPRPLSEILTDNTYVYGALKDAFPTTPLIPSIGNNDIFPHDSMPAGSNTPLLQGLADAWSLPPFERDMFLQGGYYATFPNPSDPKLLVVALNTIYWAKFNTAVSDCSNTSSAGAVQLTWLKSVLTQALAQGQGVYLTGHVPPGSGYYPGCASEYAALAEQFQGTISGHLYGHLHSDQFSLLPSPATAPGHGAAACNASAVILVAPSVTPSFNPSVRIVSFDKNATAPAPGVAPYRHLDYTQYYADINSVNKAGVFSMSVEYTFTDAYNLPDMSLQSYCTLEQELKTNVPILYKYEKYKLVSSMLPEAQTLCRTEPWRCARPIDSDKTEMTAAKLGRQQIVQK